MCALTAQSHNLKATFLLQSSFIDMWEVKKQIIFPLSVVVVVVTRDKSFHCSAVQRQISYEKERWNFPLPGFTMGKGYNLNIVFIEKKKEERERKRGGKKSMTLISCQYGRM